MNFKHNGNDAREKGRRLAAAYRDDRVEPRLSKTTSASTAQKKIVSIHGQDVRIDEGQREPARRQREPHRRSA